MSDNSLFFGSCSDTILFSCGMSNRLDWIKMYQMRKLLTFVAVIFTFAIAINSAIECHSCRALPQEQCKLATDLSKQVREFNLFFKYWSFEFQNKYWFVLFFIIFVSFCRSAMPRAWSDGKTFVYFKFCLIFQLMLDETDRSRHGSGLCQARVSK